MIDRNERNKIKKTYIAAFLMALAIVALLAGCASNASKRRVGLGISKSPGQKAHLNVSAGRTVGKNDRGYAGASKQVK